MAQKVLIFSTSYYPFVGGAEVAVKEITDRVSTTEFDLITGRYRRHLPKIEKCGNVTVYRVGFGLGKIDKLLLPFLGTLRAILLNNKNSYHVYWCIMATFASGIAYISNILQFWKKVPIVLSLQEGDSEEHFEKRWFGLINLSWRMALKRTSFLTVLSDYLLKRAARFGYKGIAEIVPNGVDVDKFDIDLNIEERNKIRSQFNFEDADIVLVTSSRLVEKNGVGDVIKSLPILEKNIKFLILGTGELEKELKELTQELNVDNRVVFKGFVSHGEIVKYLKASDVFIRASLSEGFGNSFIEAMAAKLPVIATPVGGISDFLEDGKTGYLCIPSHPESVAMAINRVIKSEDRRSIVENAFKMVKERYTWEIAADKMKKIFDNYK